MASTILAMVCILVYKFFDEMQDEAVRSRFTGLPEQVLRFLNHEVKWLSVNAPFMGHARKWKWYYADQTWNPVEQKTSPWYYLGIYKPQQKERFPFSSTILVPLTDGEHLFQFLKDLCIGLGMWADSGNIWVGVGAFGMTYLLGLLKELRK